MHEIESSPPHARSLQAYEAGITPEEVLLRFGIQDAIKLSSNENPFGASPKAIEYAQRSLQSIFRYPDGGLALRKQLAQKFQTKLENVIVGAGSEGIMASIVRSFLCDSDEILTTEGAFLGFQVLAKTRGVRYRTVPYNQWRYDLEAIAEAVTEHTKLIYLANPNNPTGTFFTREEFDAFYQKIPHRVLIILDEAYFEFAANHPLYPDSMNYRYDNVITLRTFSKAYGLAAARAGYGFAHEDLIALLLKAKLPFEPAGASAAAAQGALEDEAFLRYSVEQNEKERARLLRELPHAGLTIVPSAANFVMAVFPDEESANQIFQALLRQGVIIRPLKATGLPNCLRISVGSAEENQRLLDALKPAVAQLEPSSYATSH